MTETLKIVLPMAGYGSRLRPLTWSRPKQLLSLADNSVIGHILNMFKTLPDPENVEFIFIVGYLAEKIEAYMHENFPDVKTHFVLQEEMKGQSHAIHQAKSFLTDGPMLMVFADTLIETNFGFLADETAECVAWVHKVPDPRRFGVAEVGDNGLVTRLIEKPDTIENDLAVVGFYYFAHADKLIDAIETQMEQGTMLKGEFFLADAINIMLARGMVMRTEEVEVWLDAGVPGAMLDTNRYLLENGSGNLEEGTAPEGVTIHPPVYVHPSAVVQNATLGPHVSLGAGCYISGSTIKNSIVETEARLTDCEIQDSLVGQRAKLNGVKGIINIGDDSVLTV